MAVARRRKAPPVAEEPGTITFGVSGYGLARYLALGASWYTTYLLVIIFGADWFPAVLISIGLEIVFYRIKELVFIRSKGNLFGWTGIGLDTLTNAGGIWPLVLKLDNSDTWKMWAKAFGLGTEVHDLPALLIALAVGFILSIAPFLLKEADDES
jgi:hypothetical protein